MWEAGAELTALGSYCSEGPQRASAEIWMLVPKPSPAWLLLLSLTNPLSGSLTLTPSTAHAVSLLYGNCASYVKFCECHRIEIFFTLYWILLSKKQQDYSTTTDVFKNFNEYLYPGHKMPTPRETLYHQIYWRDSNHSSGSGCSTPALCHSTAWLTAT